MRIIVTFDLDCIFLQKRKNAKLNFDFDSIKQECRTNQLRMRDENDKVSTDLILLTTTTIITRRLQIIYDTSKLAIIYR